MNLKGRSEGGENNEQLIKMLTFHQMALHHEYPSSREKEIGRLDI